MKINIKNVQEKIFSDRQLQLQLNEFGHYFNVWRISKAMPSFKHQGTQAVIDLLNNLNERHVKILEEYFQTEVTICKLDEKTVKNYSYSLDKAETLLDPKEHFTELALYRSADHLYVSFIV